MVDKIINKQDILQFINQEKRKPNVNDINRIFKFFLKIMNKSSYEIYIKIKNVVDLNLNYIIKCGTDLIWHVFWIIYSYSFNIKLTMFLSERCILLFTEFILMSKNPILNNDLNFIPNINDALQFSIKKTIGPLKIPIIKSLKIKEIIYQYKNLSFDYKYLTQNIFETLICNYHKHIEKDHQNYESFDLIENNLFTKNKDILDLLDNIINNYNKSILNINNLNLSQDQNVIYIIIKNSFNKDFNLNIKLCIFKIYLELYYDLGSKNYNFDIELFSNLVSKLILDNQSEISSLDFNSIHLIKKKKLYKHFLNKLISDLSQINI